MGFQIEPLSSINIGNADATLALLNYHDQRSIQQKTVGVVAATISYRTKYHTPRRLSGHSECVICLEANPEYCSGQAWFEIDVPLVICYQWARLLEQRLVELIPAIQIANRLGICNCCGQDLPLKHFTWFKRTTKFCCDNCRPRRKKFADITDISAGDELDIEDHQLRVAMHEVYGGKCQYCADPTPLPIERMVIEHIVPRSVKLSTISHRLQKMGVAPHFADHFCTLLLPPNHNCVLNLTWSCGKHNGRKNGRVITPASLEFLLQHSKTKAARVLKHYIELRATND